MEKNYTYTHTLTHTLTHRLTTQILCWLLRGGNSKKLITVVNIKTFNNFIINTCLKVKSEKKTRMTTSLKAKIKQIR